VQTHSGLWTIYFLGEREKKRKKKKPQKKKRKIDIMKKNFDHSYERKNGGGGGGRCREGKNQRGFNSLLPFTKRLPSGGRKGVYQEKKEKRKKKYTIRSSLNLLY